MLGIAASSLAWLGYRRVPRTRPAIVTAALAGSLVLGVLWAAASVGYAWAIGVALDVPAELAYSPRCGFEHVELTRLANQRAGQRPVALVAAPRQDRPRGA